MVQYDAIPGISTMHFTSWVGHGALRVGDFADDETARIGWHSLPEVANLIHEEQVSDGPSLTALSFYLTTRITSFGSSRDSTEKH